ncbi:hypothetical protein O6H91_02G039500 [Diphasiastrum complanatum]|uniref:Uncharacterized protein n=1 Tax=Diphasiastrum complanatum TaxID=34168 RepID=A0ACC2EEJ1_DIPCM|nr:hypothetical protein O6H91_02G039500 [Diphasiastrum complanatum]
MHDPQNWNLIAEKLHGKSGLNTTSIFAKFYSATFLGKKCRLRWFNQLNPRINSQPLTEEDEESLLAAHSVHRNKCGLQLPGSSLAELTMQ